MYYYYCYLFGSLSTSVSNIGFNIFKAKMSLVCEVEFQILVLYSVKTYYIHNIIIIIIIDWLQKYNTNNNKRYRLFLYIILIHIILLYIAYNFSYNNEYVLERKTFFFFLKSTIN